MRNPSLVKLLFGVAVVSLAACQCGPPEPALQVLITIDPTVPATCVVLEVSSGGTVRLSQELKRPAGKNAYRVGIKKLQLPNELQLVARSYSSTSGAGCGEPRFQTSASAPVDAAFPKSDVATFTVEIHPPGLALDADADGHLDLAKGGDDCNDQDNAIHPGLAAACGSGLDNDCDGKIGCADSECATAAICNQPPAGLAFVTTAAPVSVNACSPALTIEVRDANNTPALVAVDTGVALGVIPAGGVILYSDAACLTAVTQVTVPLGQSRASFHFKAAAAGSFEATATVLGLPTATQTQTVIQATVAQVAFTNPPLTVATGACSGQLTLQTRDGNGNAAPVPAAASIALSSNQAGVAFFSDPACATALLNSALPIAAGASGGSFYVRASSIQPTTLTATLAALPPVSQALTVTAGAPTQLAFATPAQGIGSGVCSTVVTVETRDPANNLSPVAAATTVTLNATGVAIGLFADSNCTVPITAPLALAAGGSSVSFHFSGTVVGMATIRADATGLTQATQIESIGVGAPAKLVLSAAQSITAGQCSAAATVGTQDANSNPSNVTGAPLPVTLGGPATGFAFFSDSGCATAVTGPLSIPVGSASATFYFRGTAAGAQNITATAASLSPAMATHTINPAAPSVLAFTSPVQSQVAGTCAQFDLEARDAFGNPSAPSAAQTVTLASAPAITFSAAAGCAASATSVSLVGTTVSFFGRGTVAGAKALTPTAPFGAGAQTYTVTPGAAAQLGFTVQPTNAIAGAALAPAVEVAIQDSFGNTVPAATANVTVAIGTNPGTGVLSGTLTVAAVAGVASFATLAIDKTGLGYTLGATSGSLTAATSAAFDIAAGAPAALTFSAQPTTATAGAALAPAVQVTVRDAQGNLVTGSTANVTVGIGTNPGTGVLSGTLTLAAVAGVATFSDLAINRTGTGYTLAATSGTLTGATSASFDITVGPAAQLVFSVQPTAAVAGAAIAPAVQVAVQDAQGNPVTTSTANVTVAIGTNPGTGVLSGTLTVAAVAGVASFSTLSINRTGPGYTLGATSGALGAATSSAFDITPGAAALLAFFGQPSNTVAGAAIDPSPRVEITDALGNRVTASTASVTIAIGTNPGAGALSGTTTVAAVAGLASFPGLSINKSGTGYTLGATSLGLAAATSATFDISAGAAAQLAFTVQPGNALSTAAIAPAPQVVVQDALGNTVPGSTANVTIAIANNPSTGTLAGTVTVAAVAGVATFSTLSIDKAGVGYTLSASSGVLPAATSSAFNITVGPAAKLAILGSPLTFPALNCSALRTVELQDAGGNTVTATGATVVTYAAAPGAATTTFYSDAACTVLLTAPTRTIGVGASQTPFYFLAQNATATLTLTVSGAGLADGTQTATITAAVATDLAFTTLAPTVEAGFCQALTLERQDRLGRPTSPVAPTTVSLASLPATGIQFFSDTACITALAASFDILTGASSTVVYVKGISGSLTGTVPGNQVYDLTASSAGLNSGTLAVTVQPMVRRRSAACTLGGATVTCAVTPTLSDISRTILFFQATPSDADRTASDDNVSCRLNLNVGVAEVICDRVGSAANISIEWQTVSFPYSYANGGVTVQHLNGGCTAAATNTMPIVTAVTTPSAALGDSFVLFSTRSTGNDNDGQDFFQSRLTDTPSLSLNILQSDPSTTCAATMGFAAQVVSWKGAAVNRAVTTGGAGGSFTASQATTALSPTFLLYSSRMTGDTGGNNNLCRRRLRGIITDTTTLTFDRGCTGANIQDISWEHVQLPTGASVQAVAGAIAAAGTTQAVAITAVDLTRSFAFTGGLGQGGTASGRTDYATDDRVGSALARTVLTANNQLTFTRTSTSGNSAWQGYVVQLSP